jgi:protein involved in polysaccharide export with SLBB domain
MESIRCWTTVCLASLLLIVVCAPDLRANEYVLRSGDTLTVLVADHQEFGGTVTISPGGTIRLPVVNEMAAAGKTIPDLTAELIKAYKKRLLEPEVYVTLATARVSQVYIVGAVNKPGIYPLQTGSGIFEVLMLAGGLAGAADESGASLVRKATGEVLAIDLPRVVAGVPAANLALEDGDLLRVDWRQVEVYVGGAVKTPGIYSLPAASSIFQLLMLAGGLTAPPEGCAASLVRKASGEVLPIELKQVMSGAPQPELILAQGDFLRVEKIPTVQVYVTGQVEVPGLYELPENVTFSQAVAAAKGIRGDPADCQAVVQRGTAIIQVDLAAIFNRADPAADIPLQRLDSVRVEASTKTVSISGEVARPAAYQLGAAVDLRGLLNLAGGVTPFADLAQLTLTHADGTQETVDYDSLTRAGGTQALRSGDQVAIPGKYLTVTLTGQVNKPGATRLPPGASVADALLLAGGPTVAASLSAVKLLHPDGTEELLDLKEAERAAAVALRDGDQLVIPDSNSRVAVMGNVRNPGYFPISEFAPFTAVQAVLTAGGFADKAQPGKSYVIRPLPDGRMEKIPIDLHAAMKSGDPEENVLLAPGDTVYVPKSSGLTWSGVRGALSDFWILRALFGL